VAQEAAARQGTHATKTRGLVRGGGKKPYRQKGTGRARQGSLRAPQYAGGGTVHGPQPRSYVQRTPKKMKAAALRGALSDRAANGRIAVVSGFVDSDSPRTRDAMAVLRTAIGLLDARLTSRVLVVAEAEDERTWKSLRNAPGVRVLATGQLNTYDVLASEHIVFTEAALSAFTGQPIAPSTDQAQAPKRRASKPKADAAPKARIPDPRDILLRPVISEKTYRLADDGKYTFLVDRDANRTQVRQAVEAVFGVKVTGVNTLNRPGKRRRTRFGWGQRASTKRAIVSLADGERIDVFGGPVS
jgi:large subunit ribosomal protein L4